MLIANPLYDVVFKYLLEDLEIARGLLSAILGEEIVELEVKPQETSVEVSGGLHVLRFDFKALVRSSSGERKVLIELQKAKQVLDVMRFRRYLGDNYRKTDVVATPEGKAEKRALPIVTIYFLGFRLEHIRSGVVKINREYRDVVTQEVLAVREDFAELLTHDSYLIQVQQLPQQARSELERVLQVFSPVYQSQSDIHQLDFPGESSSHPLVQRMVARLGRAIASEDIRDKMDVEDELEQIVLRETQKLEGLIAAKEQQLHAEMQRAEAEKQRAEAEKQRAETEKQRAEAEKRKNEELLQQIEELKKQIKS